MDADAFHAFEHAGWEQAAAHYGGAFGALTSQTIDRMLDAIGVRRGMRMLDVATGPGFAALAAAERGARVVGVDFAAEMVAQAEALRQASPVPLQRSLSFREGDAEALPFADGTFDAAVMNFGLLHLGRPERALAEAARVLRTGRRFAFTVWDEPALAVGFRLVLEAVEAHGQTDVGLPEGPPFFRFADAAESRAMLHAAGFTDVWVDKRPLLWQIASADELLDNFLAGAVRTRALLEAQTPDALTAIRAAMREAVVPFAADDGGYALPTPAVLTIGTKR